MSIVARAAKVVSSPNVYYDSMAPLWVRTRALCSGERFVKDLDSILDVITFSNLLLPFSPSMSQEQYNFYRAEAELPGVTASFSKMLVGGLLRKPPVLELSKKFTSEFTEWLNNNISVDGGSLVSFLDQALWEEIQTSRAWVRIDYPKVESEDTVDANPYVVLHKAEEIINWKVAKNSQGKLVLTQLIIRGYEEEEDPNNEFHPIRVEVCYVHEIKDNVYQVRKFKSKVETTQNVSTGKDIVDHKNSRTDMQLEEEVIQMKVKGTPLTEIPAWPLNGSISLVEPILKHIVDKEIALYNKISRRNHLLYGAATYTPVISGSLTEQQQGDIVKAGLGSWLFLPENAKADVLRTPTEALSDMEKAIASNIEEMAKLGVRMLAPENNSSGVALDLRNANQTAQIGVLNSKISAVMTQVIQFMIYWKTGERPTFDDVKFSLSQDFDDTPLGDSWLRLATEWYENGHIPRSAWLHLLKKHEMVPAAYDDKKGQQEILKERETFKDSEDRRPPTGQSSPDED